MKTRISIVLTMAAVLAACADYPAAAREKFSKDRSCPIDGVVATDRPSLSAHDTIFGKAEPPKEIAADPARLAMWQAERDKIKKSWDSSTHIIEVQGCNEKVYMSCSRGKRGASCSITSRKVP